MPGLQSRSLTPFGCEIGLDAVPGNDTATAEQSRELYRRDGLLVIHGLQLGQQEQIELCRIFGPVHESPFENFLVSNVDQTGHLGTRELLWHNDVPFLPSPYLGASLHALHVDPDVVGTRFASGYRAYERLPETLRNRLEGMRALHVRERVYDRPNRLTDLKAGDICTVHDVVRTNPRTGRKYLFVNEAWTAQIIGLPELESNELLAELFCHFYADSEVYEHRWAQGDLVLWDNLAVQHSRGTAATGARTLQRVTITEFGYAQQYPTGASIYDELHNDAMLDTELV